MRPPRIVFPKGMTADMRAELREAIIAEARIVGGLDDDFETTFRGIEFDTWDRWCEECCGQWRVVVSAEFWALPSPVRENVLRATGPCPACHPDPELIEQRVPSLTPEQRAALVHALARTDAVHEMAVAADLAQSQGRTGPERWHNPEDVAEIERLRAALAERAPPTARLFSP